MRDPRAGYRQTLELLARVKRMAPGTFTKSSLMLGLGEQPVEVRAALRDLRAAGAEFVTLGQYLRPTPGHLPVQRYVTPAEFDAWRTEAESMGFLGRGQRAAGAQQLSRGRVRDPRRPAAENGMSEMLQILMESGRAAAGAPTLPKAKLLEIYEFMLRTRLLDERMLNLQRQGRIGFYVPSTGEEAAQIGCALATGKRDWTIPATACRACTSRWAAASS